MSTQAGTNGFQEIFLPRPAHRESATWTGDLVVITASAYLESNRASASVLAGAALGTCEIPTHTMIAMLSPRGQGL